MDFLNASISLSYLEAELCIKDLIPSNILGS